MDERARRRDEKVTELERQREEDMSAMPSGERRWERHVVASTETKLSMLYSNEAGMHYAPSGGISTAHGRLFVPWPLPKQQINFRGDSANSAGLDSSSDESDEELDSSDSEEEEEEEEQEEESPEEVEEEEEEEGPRRSGRHR